MIKLYTFDESARSFTEVSAGTFNTPIAVRAVPNGSAGAKKLFVRNDDSTKFYTEIKLSVVAQAGLNIIESSSVDCRLLSGDTQPTEEEWSLAESGAGYLLTSPLVVGVNLNRKRLPSLGSSAAADEKYYPLWVRVKTKAPLRPGEYQYRINVEYVEGMVA